MITPRQFHFLGIKKIPLFLFPLLVLCLSLPGIQASDLKKGPVTITFVNYTTMEADVFQVTPDGRDIFKSRLTSGASYDLKIPSGFTWRVKASKNGALLMEGIASPSENYIEIEAKSSEGGTPVTLVFNNYAGQPVNYFWIDGSGRAIEQGVIPAGGKATQPAKSSSSWIFKSLQGEKLGDYFASDRLNQSYTIKGNGTPSPSGPEKPVISGGSTTPIGGSSGSNKNNNHPSSGQNLPMLEVYFLGIGYDAVHVEPENLAQNSVQNNSSAPPRVFEFEADPSREPFIITKSRDMSSESKLIPKGVTASKGETAFSWSSKARWVKTASQYQSSFTHAYSGSVGVPGVASVSLSASFKNVQSVTQRGESAYVYKDGSFKGHIMKMDMNDRNLKLTDEFRDAVSRLGNSPAAYDAFLLRWGTHFSVENTMGARCYYRFTLSKSSYIKSNENVQAFEQGVEASLGRIGGSIGASQEDMEASRAEESTHAQEKLFNSFGASGERSFSDWSKDAQHNRTVIDVRLKSYLELFNTYYFPGDQQMAMKYRLLKEALDRYYKKHAYRETVDPRALYNIAPRTYTVKVTRLYVKHGENGSNDSERHYGGILKLGVYNEVGQEKKNFLFMNLNGGGWLDWGQWKGNYLKLKEGADKFYNNSFSITLSPKDFTNSFATITGKMTETWHAGTTAGIKSMGTLSPHDTESDMAPAFGKASMQKIHLVDLEKGKRVQKKVIYSHQEGDQVEIYFEVTRTN